jgi:mannose-6-phosphate isomerase class I
VVECPVFVMEIHDVAKETSVSYEHDHPLMVMCLEGKVAVETDGGRVSLVPGQTALTPAAAKRTKLSAVSGATTVLAGWPR